MGYEQLKSIIEDNKLQVELARQEMIDPIKCPMCANVPLRENGKGQKLCPICGWTDRLFA